MQQSTNAPVSPDISIRESGRMYCLCSEGRVIGFAASLGFAQVRAKELGFLSSVESQTTTSACGQTAGPRWA